MLDNFYFKRAEPLAFKLPSIPTIQWVGINSYGSWDCTSPRQIPVWKDKGQRYCTGGGSVVEAKPSVWDALSLGKDAPQAQPNRADEAEGQAPIEEVAPTE
ncbi:hypothetical protein Q7511_07165 [Glaesserella parasuis]|nr:hypothetical protein [Glaesserella parasuis]MDO9860509.1 hypothetical protein [Glaesserella parasuis]